MSLASQAPSVSALYFKFHHKCYHLSSAEWEERKGAPRIRIGKCSGSDSYPQRWRQPRVHSHHHHLTSAVLYNDCISSVHNVPDMVVLLFNGGTLHWKYISTLPVMIRRENTKKRKILSMSVRNFWHCLHICWRFLLHPIFKNIQAEQMILKKKVFYFYGWGRRLDAASWRLKVPASVSSGEQKVKTNQM